MGVGEPVAIGVGVAEGVSVGVGVGVGTGVGVGVMHNIISVVQEAPSEGQQKLNVPH